MSSPSNPLPNSDDAAQAMVMMQNLLSLMKANPGFRDLMERSLLSTRPESNSKSILSKTNGTYYKEFYGRQIKVIVDDMLETRKRTGKCVDKTFFLEKFPTYTFKTLQCRIEQSLRYLVNELDNDFTYMNFRKEITLAKVTKGKRDIGISIRWNENIAKDEGDLVGVDSIPLNQVNEWKLKLDQWLAVEWNDALSKEARKLHLKNLILSPEEVSETEMLIRDLAGIQGNITESEIFLIKTNPDA